MASGKSYDVSELEVCDNTTVHGHILELSPIQTSKNKPDCSYFNGKLSDGVKVARFVSVALLFCSICSRSSAVSDNLRRFSLSHLMAKPSSVDMILQQVVHAY